MRSRGTNNSSKTKIYIGIGIFVLVLISLSVLINTDADADTGDIKTLKKPVRAGPPPAYHITPGQFVQRSTKLHETRKHLEDNNVQQNLVVKRCQALTQQQQLLDLECTASWLNVMRRERIVSVERLWGFDNTHFGAITLKLEGGTRAMFKPCTSSSEDTTREVIASYLDQLLSWGQTAPVMTRKIPISDLRNLCDTPEKLEVFEDTVNRCGLHDGTFLGPMIGWWESLIPIRTVRKYKQDIEVSVEMRTTEFANNLLATQMQSKYHAFYWLIYILRHGKDEFITNNGNLVSLDLDRSRYKHTDSIISPSLNYTWCYSCYMDKWVYDTFTAVGPSQPEANRLGELMKTILSFEDLMPFLWDTRLATALDTRVEMLLECVDHCIDQYGRDNVLLNEPNWMTSKELVTYFVMNSVYKNQNGQEGPSNFDFLNDL